MGAPGEGRATAGLTLPQTALKWKRSRELMAYYVRLFDKPMNPAWRSREWAWQAAAIFKALKDL